MTNYNKRVNEQLNYLMEYSYKYGKGEIPSSENPPLIIARQAKQAITSLIKELVAEALKELKEEVIGEVPSKINTDNWKYDRRVAELKLWQHQAIDQKIKALEEE